MLLDLPAQRLQGDIAVVDLAAQRFVNALQLLHGRGQRVGPAARPVALGLQFRLPLPRSRVQLGQLGLQRLTLLLPVFRLFLGMARRLLAQLLPATPQMAGEAVQFLAAPVEDTSQFLRHRGAH